MHQNNSVHTHGHTDTQTQSNRNQTNKRQKRKNNQKELHALIIPVRWSALVNFSVFSLISTMQRQNERFRLLWHNFGVCRLRSVIYHSLYGFSFHSSIHSCSNSKQFKLNWLVLRTSFEYVFHTDYPHAQIIIRICQCRVRKINNWNVE